MIQQSSRQVPPYPLVVIDPERGQANQKCYFALEVLLLQYFVIYGFRLNSSNDASQKQGIFRTGSCRSP